MVKPRTTKRQQPAESRLRIRHVLAAILAAALIAAGITGWQWARYANWGPTLTRMVVRGNLKRVAPADVRAVVKPYLNGGFFRVDLDAIRTAVESMPWVAQAAVHLDWPSTLKVTLREQRAVARYNGGGLVNADGVRFVREAPADTAGLPRLAGPPGAAARVLAAWRTMQPRLKKHGLTLKALALDARGAWRARLANGLSLRLGRDDASRNLRRFIELVPRVLNTRLAKAAYIDLRYTNGFAVGWKDSTSKDQGKGKAHA